MMSIVERPYLRSSAMEPMWAATIRLARKLVVCLVGVAILLLVMTQAH